MSPAPDREEGEGPIVIIGAGQAGGRAAEALRQGGYTGAISIVGDEPHPPHERPSLSKDFLHSTELADIAWVRPLDWYAENRVALLTGRRALKIDRQRRRVELDDGAALDYYRLVIATGARPRRLAVEGADHPAVRYLRTLGDSQRLGRLLRPGGRIVVVGAGFIGLEVAATARKRGAEVTVLELGPSPMGRAVPPTIGAFYAQLHRSKGVDLRLGTGVARILDQDGKARVELTDGARLDADAVVVGIGVVPNSEIAAEAGLVVEDGVVVDEYGRTADPAIFAAGDVTSHFNPFLGHAVRLESWQNAQNQAIAVAKSILSVGAPYHEVPWFWSDQYDLNLQIAGMPRAGDEVVQRGRLDGTPMVMFHFRGGKLAAVIGVNSPREVRFGKEIIAMGGNVSAEQLADPALNLMTMVRAMKKTAPAQGT